MGYRVIIIKDNLPRCAAEALARQDELCTNVAKVMHVAAKGAAPVLTGALKAGIELHSGNPASVTASSTSGGAPREYAAYNEFGTSKMAAQPFMMPGYMAGLAAVPAEGRKYGAWIEAVA